MLTKILFLVAILKKIIDNSIEDGLKKYTLVLKKAPANAKYIEVFVACSGSRVVLDNFKLAKVAVGKRVAKFIKTVDSDDSCNHIASLLKNSISCGVSNMENFIDNLTNKIGDNCNIGNEDDDDDCDDNEEKGGFFGGFFTKPIEKGSNFIGGLVGKIGDFCNSSDNDDCDDDCNDDCESRNSSRGFFGRFF